MNQNSKCYTIPTCPCHEYQKYVSPSCLEAHAGLCLEASLQQLPYPFLSHDHDLDPFLCLVPCLILTSHYQHDDVEGQTSRHGLHCQLKKIYSLEELNFCVSISMYSLQHLYTNNLKQNTVNVNGKTTICVAHAAAHMGGG
jgi:hypothetical protein